MQFDCLIVGGGMIGAASALVLADLGLKVAVVEAFPAKAFSQEQPFDLRVSAISVGSEKLLKQLNTWRQISDWRLCPYARLGVWEHELSYAEFNSINIEEPHLGHIIENRLIQLSLWQQMEARENITLMCPETLNSFSETDSGIVAQLSCGEVKAKIIIGADGANSHIRAMAKIGTTGWDYQQSAMLINVTTEIEQQDITWQYFSPTGPLAYLPMPGNNASLVWYQHRDEIKRLSSLSNSQLTTEVQRAFPELLGKINVVDKGSFNLTRRHANQYVKGRVLLIGDSAHSINPLAGQGVNLGFKDVMALQRVFKEAINNGEDFSNTSVLAQYEKQRRSDNLLMMSAMDLIYAGFKHKLLPTKLLRNIGLFTANRIPLLKEKALKYACGIK